MAPADLESTKTEPIVTSTENTPRVYCAGPLFNQSERREMTAIAEVINEAGFPVFLPHRDGMEFRRVHHVLTDRGWNATQSAQFLHAAIFALDVYHLADACGAMVWNLNGRVPDEGAVCEAAIAWTLGKPLVAYSDDARSLISGRPNPLLVGLVEFETISELKEIPQALTAAIVGCSDRSAQQETLPVHLQRTMETGDRLWDAMTGRNAHCDDEAIADVVVELFATEPQTLG